MMTFEEVQELIANDRSGLECIREYRDAMNSGGLVRVHTGPGHMLAHIALGTFRIRAGTAREAGIETCGLEETLRGLSSLAETDNVFLFHFTSRLRIFSFFVSESKRSLIGCIRIDRRE